MGFDSVRDFSRRLCSFFCQPPIRVLIQTRLTCILYITARNPGLSGYEVAIEVGLKDEKALYDFLVHHGKTTLSELRNQVNNKTGENFQV